MNAIGLSVTVTTLRGPACRLPFLFVATAPALRVAADEHARDAALIADALAGSERAFAALCRRHARYIAGVAYRLLGTDADLDDVVQETYCDASHALATLKEPAGLRAWLARIAVRRVHKPLAQRKRSQWLLGQAEHLVAHVSDPRARQEVEGLYEALDTLAPELRIPWTLHELDGETLPAVADACELSLATAKRRIAEAASRIEQRLRR
jgi:RNA polymerase sigma-70 factor (ECF subfamily)